MYLFAIIGRSSPTFQPLVSSPLPRRDCGVLWPDCVIASVRVPGNRCRRFDAVHRKYGDFVRTGESLNVPRYALEAMLTRPDGMQVQTRS